ncbi:MAG: NADH-quinone oxidoreductase subunit NuoF [Oscillospiraceae bacterium]|nr:NADH-quinone oxidoreductase subunit NuoF [Oscillospiraceae bacterium]
MIQESRLLLRNVDVINPVDAYAYINAGGYAALKKAVSMDGSDIINVIKASKLRGRGGAGFPAGLKWGFAYNTQAGQKYIVCNADEGEPGTNKDRFLLSGDPNAVFEGMAIAGRAVGADKGYIYLRAEYPYIMPILEKAIENAKAANCLGNNIFGSDFNFDIEVCSGGGAYVCGEETALLESIEGKRGEPRFKPPFPGVSGLYGKPTVINNVETLANVPLIINNGAEWYTGIGTEKCPGTKLYTLSGNVKNRGTYEFPMGVNLRDLIYEAGGGIENGRNLLAVQTGGASCPIINASQIDFNLDIEQAWDAGASLGSGAMLIIDDSNDMLDVLRNIQSFFVHESCGKCTPCREGNKRLYELISKFVKGRGTAEDVETIKDLASTMSMASLCGLGQAASSAAESVISNFPQAFNIKSTEGGLS